MPVTYNKREKTIHPLIQVHWIQFWYINYLSLYSMLRKWKQLSLLIGMYRTLISINSTFRSSWMILVFKGASSHDIKPSLQNFQHFVKLLISITWLNIIVSQWSGALIYSEFKSDGDWKCSHWHFFSPKLSYVLYIASMFLSILISNFIQACERYKLKFFISP